MDPMTSSILYMQFSYLSAYLLLVTKIISKGMHEFVANNNDSSVVWERESLNYFRGLYDEEMLCTRQPTRNNIPL